MDVVREGGPLLGAEVGALLGATFVLIIARKLSEPAALGVDVALGLDRPSLPILEMASTFGGRFMIVVEGRQGGKVTLRSTVYAYCFHWCRNLRRPGDTEALVSWSVSSISRGSSNSVATGAEKEDAVWLQGRYADH